MRKTIAAIVLLALATNAEASIAFVQGALNFFLWEYLSDSLGNLNQLGPEIWSFWEWRLGP